MATRRVRTDKAFGKRLRQAMTEAEIGTGELAKLESVGVGQVSRWRRGELPNDLRYPSLADHLRVPLKWLKTGQGGISDLAGTNGAQIERDGARAGDSATATVEHPAGERARKILELRLQLIVAEGRVPTSDEMHELWQLALWAQPAIRPTEAEDVRKEG